MEQYQKDFIERTESHIERVAYFLSKLDHYPNDIIMILGKNHDADKLYERFDDYSLMNKENLTTEEEARLDRATRDHILYNTHHPEHWCIGEDLIRILNEFTRKSPIMNLNCYDMPQNAMEEMCADWCAMSDEFGNTPFEWADKNIGTRWIFDENQKDFIYKTLNAMWWENDLTTLT